MKEIWNEPFQVMDLPQTSDADFEELKLCSAMAKLMKYIHSHKDSVSPLLRKVAEDLRKTRPVCAMDYIYIALSYLLECANIYNAEEFKKTVQKEFSEISEENFMRNVNPWRDQGLQEGRQQGLQEGLRRGKTEVARAMLKNGMSAEDVSKMTGLALSDILELEQK
jgi:predicted transposase/invertase (TIGR01784 family)